VSASFAIGVTRSNAQTELTAIDAQLGKKTLTMAQMAPGSYQAEFATPQAGSYHLEFAQRKEGKLFYQQSRGLAVGYPDELRLLPTNQEHPQAITRVSGGQFDPPAESIFASTDRTVLRATPLWPWLLMAAALLFVADVALRRIDFSRPGRVGVGRRARYLFFPSPNLIVQLSCYISA
jgi:Ca-activated chloride channel homolog